MLEAVILDVDGVIVDSEELYFRAVQETFRKYGIEIDVDEYIRRYMLDQTSTPGMMKDYKDQITDTLEAVRARKSEISKRIMEAEL